MEIGKKKIATIYLQLINAVENKIHTLKGIFVCPPIVCSPHKIFLK